MNPKLNRLLVKTGELIVQLVVLFIGLACVALVIFGLGRLAELLN